MASSLYLPGRYAFYPIGNTTPVSLTRDLPPDVPANILLLPSGDPRNILYTVFCEKTNILRNKLDFTCCDYDPGILGRNVLLLTMIMDRVADQTVWNIFFHMYLDIDSCSILVSQSQKLASYDSMDAWRSSPYGAVIRIGTDHTFAELQRHWELYADFYHPSRLHRLRALQQTLDARLKERAAAAPEININPLRSSGLSFLHSQASSLFSKQYQRYWATGTTFTDKSKLIASTHPNSTFLYSRSGEGVNVSHNTDPMTTFPHDALFGNAGDRILTIEDLVDSAYSQFRAWCSAFQTATTTEAKTPVTLIVIRFLLGDVLAVARSLQVLPENPPSGPPHHPLATIRVAPWTACQMELNWKEYANLGAPVRFDVIDTSNVSEYLGLLNLFVATAPLLTRSPSSVLYTESFPLLSSDPVIEFEATLFARLSVVAVLMDLAPVDVLSGFTTRSNTHELLITYLRSKDRDVHHQRFTWKRPSSGDPSAYPDGGTHPHILFNTHQLAKLLHNIYLDVFRIEDPQAMLTLRRALGSKGTNDEATRALLHGVIVCPSREGFVAFLGFVRTSLSISEEQWSDVMRSFLDVRAENQPHVDKLRDSDVHAQLYRYGLYTVPGLDHSHPSSPSPTTEPRRLSHWRSIPPLIRIFFTVPRNEFAKLERAVVAEKVATNVWLLCLLDIGPEHELHCFQSLDAAYGTLIDTGTLAEPDLSFLEDPDGHKNGADVVFSFVVPSRVLTEPSTGTAIIIRLMVRTDPNTVLLVPALGPYLCVFSVHVEDADCVHLLPEQPLPLPNPSRPPPLQTALVPGPDEVVSIGRQSPVHVELDSERRQVASLTAKLEIMDVAVQAAFAGGAIPSIRQCSPCAVEVVLGGRTQTLAYPVPIVGSQRKLRLARKSSYIEVVVPVAIPFLQPDGFKANLFPVIRANGSLVPWNVHRVVLDQLPALDGAKVGLLQLDKWYCPHLQWQHSLRERTLRASKNPAHAYSDALANVKRTMMEVMMYAAGPSNQGRPHRVFALQHSARKETDTLLFVDKLRFDVAAHTVVCDAFVLALSPSQDIAPLIAQAMPLLVPQGIMPIALHAGRGAQDPHSEMRAWKALLPAFAERCRATWAHDPNCEYRVVRPDGSVHCKIPRELPAVPGDQGDPLCSCGRGKGVEGMMRDAVWRVFAPFVTRIALSPLFGVSHIEQILETSDMRPSETQTQKAVSAGPASAPGVSSCVVGSGSTVHASGGAVDRPGVAELATGLAACERCRKEESGGVKLLKCSRCRAVMYCSAACQKGDWKTHKSRCKNPAKGQ
ncbi:hypothetical protein V8D89_002514 [Ganoderma adspersum]